MARTKPIHAASVMKCVDGSYRQFYTLCGLICGADGTGITKDPGTVTCKICLKSRGWNAMKLSIKAMEEAVVDPK